MWKRKHTLPSSISAMVDSLKKEYDSYVSARKINDTYYLYKEWLVWDAHSKRQNVKSAYIGRIKENGVFIKKSANSKLNMENAVRLIEERGGKVIMPQAKQKEHLSEIGDSDMRILTCLTMNARLTAKRIGKIAGVSERDVYYKIKVLEKAYSIKYMAQFFAPQLGYYPYLILVKFIDKKPTAAELKTAVESEPKIQLALLVNGEYDLIGYLLEENPFMAELTVLKFRTNALLSRYRAVFYTAPMSQRYGYLHLRDEFFTKVLSQKVSRKTDASEGQYPLLDRELKVLRELNSEGTLEFNEIDRRYGFNRGTALYTYEKLVKRGVIARTTMSIGKSDARYIGVIFVKRLDMSGYLKSKDYLYKDVIMEGSLINRYALICEVGSPDMLILAMPILGDDSIGENADRLREKLEGVEITSGIVTDNITGSICMRRFDNEYSYYYNDLVTEKRIPYKSRVDYENRLPHKGI